MLHPLAFLFPSLGWLYGVVIVLALLACAGGYHYLQKGSVDKNHQNATVQEVEESAQNSLFDVIEKVVPPQGEEVTKVYSFLDHVEKSAPKTCTEEDNKPCLKDSPTKVSRHNAPRTIRTPTRTAAIAKSGIEDHLPPQAVPRIKKGSVPDKVLAHYSKNIVGALKRACKILAPPTKWVQWVRQGLRSAFGKFSQKYSSAGVYFCQSINKCGRGTQMGPRTKNQTNKKCFGLFRLDDQKEEDVQFILDETVELPSKIPALKTLSYDSVTVDDIRRHENENLDGVSYFFPMLIDLLASRKGTPFEGARNKDGMMLNGVYRGHILDAVESGIQTLYKLSNGAQHEHMFASYTQWWFDALPVIDKAMKLLLLSISQIILQKYTGDERSPTTLEAVNFLQIRGIGSWATDLSDENLDVKDFFGDVEPEPTDPEQANDSSDDDSEDVDDSEDDDEFEEELGADEPKKQTLTEIISDWVYGAFRSIGKFWVDIYPEANIDRPQDDLTPAHHRNAFKFLRSAVRHLQKLHNDDPHGTVPWMFVNNVSILWKYGDTGFNSMHDYLQSEGYKLFWEFFFVRAYWYENEQCQVSLIFVHSPWHIASMTYLIWTRLPFANHELNTQASAAITVHIMELIARTFKSGNFESKANRNLVGSSLGAAAFRFYCYLNLHMEPVICSLLFKELVTYPTRNDEPVRTRPIEATTRRGAYFTRASREGKGYDIRALKKELFLCASTLDKTRVQFIEYAAERILDYAESLSTLVRPSILREMLADLGTKYFSKSLGSDIEEKAVKEKNAKTHKGAEEKKRENNAEWEKRKPRPAKGPKVEMEFKTMT